jgi:hypothetical protein
MTKTETLKSSASEISPEAQAQFEDVKTAEFKYGTIDYSVIGQANPDKNPIIIEGGMDNGRVNLLAQADLLARKGKTQVLIKDQPIYNPDVSKRLKKDPNFALDFMAEATIAAADYAGFLDEGKAANMTGHSLGGLVAERIRRIARLKNIKALLPENGSLLALMGSSGMDPKEGLLKLGIRWPKYVLKGFVEAKVLDPTGVNGKTVGKNAATDKAKTIGELKALSNNHVPADSEGALAVVYPEDYMFPVRDKRIKKTIERGEIPFVTPISADPEKTTVKGLKRFMTKAHLRGRNARLEYALHHRGAGHDDPANNPERSVDVVLDFFDHPQNYLGSNYKT